MAGQIIIVNGSSGSGKSTACAEFARHSEDFWLCYGIDHFLAVSYPAKFGQHGPRADEGICARPADPGQPDGPLCWQFSELAMRAFGAFHEWAAAASRAGCNIILDHLLLTEPPMLRDCVRRLAGLPVLLVTLKAPPEVLSGRVATRRMGDKGPGSQYSGSEREQQIRDRLERLQPWFYRSVYANGVCDVEIDTAENDPERVVELIGLRLAQGPGTAFEELRARWPRD